MKKHTLPQYVLTIIVIPFFIAGAILGFCWFGLQIGYEEMLLRVNKIYNGKH